MKHWAYCNNCGCEFQFDDTERNVINYDQTQCPDCELTVHCHMDMRWGAE